MTATNLQRSSGASTIALIEVIDTMTASLLPCCNEPGNKSYTRVRAQNNEPHTNHSHHTPKRRRNALACLIGIHGKKLSALSEH